MNKYYNYIIVILATCFIGLALWYFQNIVTYILISAVLSLIGAPVVNLLRKIKIGKLVLSKGICAALTLLLIMSILIAFFWIFIPIVAGETQKFSSIDSNTFLKVLNEPISKIDQLVNEYGASHGKTFSSYAIISEKIQSVLNIGFLTDIFGSLASVIGNIFIAIFSISFITFFFLKDEGLFAQGVLLLTPTNHENSVRKILSSTKILLMRYFVGIAAEISGIIALLSLGLAIIGIDFQTCLVIALFAGIVNVIPYVGPILAIIFGLTLGIASKIQVIAPDHLLPFVLSILAVYAVLYMLDSFVFQPFILSNSVKAHPLEIFLVILVAGHLAGIAGMLVAIPGYTVIRVIAKQFLNNFKVVKKLTEKI